jgi:hypothetical protein
MDARISRGWREGVIRDCLTNPSPRKVLGFGLIDREGQSPVFR